MFVCSCKAASIKLGVMLALAFSILLTLLIVLPSGNNVPVDARTQITYSDVKSEEDVRKFLEGLNWEVKPDSLKASEVTIPSDFNEIYTEYNDLQKSQGLDLSRYKRKTVMRYTYEISNFADWEGIVYATVLVYRDKIIGGDICSADANGFICGFEGK